MEGCGVRLLPLLRLYLYFIHIPVHIHFRHVLIWHSHHLTLTNRDCVPANGLGIDVR